MFPLDSKTLKEDIKIHHTMRIMPEDQNTGGFYIALIKKNDHVKFNKGESKVTDEYIEEKCMQKVKLNSGESSPNIQELSNTNANEGKKHESIKIEKLKKGSYRVPKLDYLPFSQKFHDAWLSIKNLYGFDDVDRFY